MSRNTRQLKPTARALASEEQNNIDFGEPEVSDGDDESGTYMPPRKRKRTLKKNKLSSFKDGPTEGLGTMPVEILTGIINYLLPLDLLHLTRTSKSLRNILMHKSSEPIWVQAATNLPFDFPTSISHMSMPFLTSMLFTRACTTCGSRTKVNKKCNPFLGIRLCADCQPNELISHDLVPKDLQKYIRSSWIDTVPNGDRSIPSGRYSLPYEVSIIESAYTNYFARPFPDPMFWEAGMRRLHEGFDQDAAIIYIAMESLKEEQENEIRRLQDSFELGVIGHLKDSGWEGDDIEFSSSSEEWKKLTRQPKALTDRAWKNLHPKLQQILEVNLPKRLEHAEARSHLLVELWETKRNELRTWVSIRFRHSFSKIGTNERARLLPTTQEAITWACVKQYNPSGWLLGEGGSLEEHWQSIQLLTESWQQAVEEQLAARLKEEDPLVRDSSLSTSAFVTPGQPVSEDLKLLWRADSAFKIKAGHIPSYYPHAFLELGKPSSKSTIPQLVTSLSAMERAWPFDLARGIAKNLLQFLGQPDATHLSMNAYGRRFLCGRCPCLNLDLKLFNWQGLLAHYIDSEAQCPANGAEDMDPELQSIYSGYHMLDDVSLLAPEFYSPIYVLPMEDPLRYFALTTPSGTMPWYGLNYACLVCNRCSTAELTHILAHLQDVHSIVNPKIHHDYEDYSAYIQQSLEATLMFES